MVNNRAMKLFGSRQTKKFQKAAQTIDTVDVFDPPLGISGTTSRRAPEFQILHE
jgi:hypothetical protein